MTSLIFTLLSLLQLSNSMSRIKPRILLPSGVPTHDHLPVCPPSAVCNKVDTYSNPWVEKQCTCPGERTCSTSLSADDGFTVLDKSRQFKVRMTHLSNDSLVEWFACRMTHFPKGKVPTNLLIQTNFLAHLFFLTLFLHSLFLILYSSLFLTL